MAMFLGACASHGSTADPPVTRGASVAVESLIPADRLQPDRVQYKRLADDQEIPEVGTRELHGAGMCPQQNSLCDVAGGAMYAATPIIVVAAIPFVMADYLRKGLGTENETAGQTSMPTECKSSGHEEGADVGQDLTPWMKSVVLRGQFADKLDAAYASALQQAFNGSEHFKNAAPGPITGVSASESMPGRASVGVKSGISRVVLLNLGQDTAVLFLCSRTIVQGNEARVRYFETCLSEPFCLPAVDSYHADSERFRESLMGQMRRLAIAKADALMGAKAPAVPGGPKY